MQDRRSTQHAENCDSGAAAPHIQRSPSAIIAAIPNESWVEFGEGLDCAAAFGNGKTEICFAAASRMFGSSTDGLLMTLPVVVTRSFTAVPSGTFWARTVTVMSTS